MRAFPKLSLTFVTAVSLLVIQGCSRTPEERYARSIAKGKKLLEGNDAGRAILEFQNATQAKPKEAEAHYLLAQAFLSNSQIRDAILALRRASETNPSYAPAQVKLAELMIMTHNDQLTKDAEARLQQVLTQKPNDDDALYTLAATQAQLGNPEDAEKHLNQILEKSPRNLRSAVALAQMKFAQRDFDGAEQILRKAVERLPDSSDAEVALGIVYARRGKTAESKSALQKAIQLNPKNVRALMALAALQVRVGDLSGAERIYQQVAVLPQKENRLAYAVFLMQQKRQADAVKELERIFKAERNDRVARSSLVAGYLASNRMADAEAVLNEALKKNGRDLEALVQRGQIYLRNGQITEAQQDLEMVLRTEPSGQAHYLMSKVYRDRGAVLLQQRELHEALRLAPESLRARFDLANSLLISNNIRAALSTLDGAQERQKRTVPYVLARNWILIALGDTVQARKGVDAVLAVSKTTDVLLQDAVLKMAAQNVASARTVLEVVLKADPENLGALSTLVQTYMAQKQPAAALEKIRQCVASRPNSAKLQLFLAQWLIESNREAEGRQAITAAKAAAPDNPIPELLLASRDMGAGRLNEARQRLTALVAKNLTNPDAHMMLGDIEEAAENHTAAIGHYRKVLEVHGNNIRALNNLAYIMCQNGIQLDEALKYAQRAKEFAPENARIQDTLGWIYFRKGLYPMALKELEAALSHEARPAVKLHLGLTYKRLGDTEKGGRLVAAALAADPTLADKDILQ